MCRKEKKGNKWQLLYQVAKLGATGVSDSKLQALLTVHLFSKEPPQKKASRKQETKLNNFLNNGTLDFVN